MYSPEKDICCGEMPHDNEAYGRLQAMVRTRRCLFCDKPLTRFQIEGNAMTSKELVMVHHREEEP